MIYKRIGIVGGVGPSATVLYYQKIIEGFRERKGDEHFPEIFIHSLDLGEIHGYFAGEEYNVLREKLLRTVNGLHQAGCDFALFSCNAMHMVFDWVQKRVKVPMVNLIDAVLKDLSQRQYKKVGLMGTTFVLRSGLYLQPLEKAGIECLMPDQKEQDWIMKAIMDDLQLPVIPEQTIERLMKVVIDFGNQGAEGVILACTDLPVGIKQEKSPISLLDSTEIHVKAVLDFALSELT